MSANSGPEPQVEVSLDAIVSNLETVRRSLLPGQKIMAVVKDCAYGCGARAVSLCLEEEGVDFFAVARGAEALDIRNAGLRSPILVLGKCCEKDLRALASANVRFSINDISDINLLSGLGVPVIAHINIDTGMGRLGILPHEVETAAKAFAGSPLITTEGLYTHFSCADIPGTETVARQQEIFCSALNRFNSLGIKPSVIHLSNSAAADRFPWGGQTYVRPGIALYGCNPDPAQGFNLNLVPAASLKAAVVKLKKVPAGTAVSYGGNYVTDCETFIATVSAGYGHGLPRLLGNRGEILINGRRYRIAGNVTMDYCMVDAGINPQMSEGDEAVLMGFQGDECIHPDKIAVMCNTIGYEILCNLSRRIKRTYIRKGRVFTEEGILY